MEKVDLSVDERLSRLESLAVGMEDRIVSKLFALLYKGESEVKKEEEVKEDRKEEEMENENEKEMDDSFMERKKDKKTKRLSGRVKLDWEKDKEDVFKPRTFVQNLNYIFQFAVESKRSKAKYIEQSNNVFGKKELVGYKFVSPSILSIAKTLVKILHEIENHDVGLLQPTDFVSSSMLTKAITAYRSKYGLTPDAVLSRKIQNQFNDVSNFVDEATGFGSMVMCIILSAEKGNGVSSITAQGFSRLQFWSPSAHGVPYSHSLVVTQLDTFTEIFEILCAIGHLLYPQDFLALPQKQLTRQFLSQITLSAPEGRHSDGRYSDLPIVELAEGVLQSQSEAFPSIQRLKQHLDEQLTVDSRSFSYAVLAKMKLKVWFPRLATRSDERADRKQRHRNAVQARENPDFMVHAMLHDEADWSDESEADDYVAAFDEDDDSSGTASDAEDEAETAYLATIAEQVAAMMPPEMSKRLPCYRFFRQGVAGCSAGERCKFSHATDNAEMQALFAKASRSKGARDKPQGGAHRTGHHPERRRRDDHRRGTRRDHRS